MLGNEEADRRYQNTLEALKQPDINYISVKISGIYAQTHALNYEESFPELVRRMSELYQTAIDYPYVDEQGNKRPKFVNLDMEEYKDFDLTIRVFKATLSKPEFLHYSAGIVVQAYLYDAWDFQSVSTPSSSRCPTMSVSVPARPIFRRLCTAGRLRPISLSPRRYR